MILQDKKGSSIHIIAQKKQYHIRFVNLVGEQLKEIYQLFAILELHCVRGEMQECYIHVYQELQILVIQMDWVQLYISQEMA